MAYHPNIPTSTGVVQDELAQMRDNFQHLAPLAPYIQALLDSRIVEMGSNSNGTYVRWENGLQVCWQLGLTIDEFFNRYELRKTWLLPAMFASETVAFMVVDAVTDNYLKTTLLRSTTSSMPSIGIRALSGFGTYEDGDTVRVSVFAIGRWK